MKKLLSLLLALAMLLSFAACTHTNDTDDFLLAAQETLQQTQPAEVTESEETLPPTLPPTEAPTEAPTDPPIDKDGDYYSAEDVALYLYTYGCLPRNFITKQEARSMGWSGGSVEYYAEGCAIGGDRFGNYEGLLPDAPGRQYYECDIDTNGYKSRGPKRLVYSNDGLIYYTEDHYASFVLLYGEER